MFLASESQQSTEHTSWLVKALHCILSLTICVFFENLKLPKEIHIVLFYTFTFSKFCVLIFAVAMVTKLFIRNKNEDGWKMKQC